MGHLGKEIPRLMNTVGRLTCRGFRLHCKNAGRNDFCSHCSIIVLQFVLVDSRQYLLLEYITRVCFAYPLQLMGPIWHNRVCSFDDLE